MKPATLFCLFCLAAPLAAQETTEPPLSPKLAEAQAAVEAGDLDKAIGILRKEAENGDPDAAVALGDFYLVGRGVEASAATALEWFEKAGAKGDASALLRQGEIYAQGAPGVEPNLQRARFCLQNAAEGGANRAWYWLGKIEETMANNADADHDREEAFTKAREHFQKGSEAGDSRAQFDLAMLIEKGNGGEKDPKAAFDLMLRSADQGWPEAMNEVAIRYQNGEIVDRNSMTALGWFLGAAERGNSSAMTNLGMCYLKGIGVPQNINQAGNWFAKAAQLNEPRAQFQIGQLFEKGIGTEPNPVSAYINYSRSAKSGYQSAEEARQKLEKTLSQEQLKEAKDFLEKGAD